VENRAEVADYDLGTEPSKPKVTYSLGLLSRERHLSKEIATVDHGNLVRKGQAKYSMRLGELSLTDRCLQFEVKDINFPRRVRDLHIPLDEIVAIDDATPSFSRNAFTVKLQDGRNYDFMAYGGGIPVDVLPLYARERQEWVSILFNALAHRGTHEACQFQETSSTNPQAQWLALWVAIAALITIVLTLADVDFGLIPAVIGFSAVIWIVILRNVKSG
jgi:hypothetical protein